MKKILSLYLMLVLGLTLLVSCAKKYVVSFETDGGSEVAAVEVAEGEKVTKPADPTKTDLTFGGWYADADLIDVYDFEQPVVAEMTLYAKWNVTITFETNGGTAVDPVVTEPLKVFELPTTTRENYIFGGWYQDAAYTKPQTFLAPTKNATVYARWQVLDEGTKIDLHQGWIESAPGALKVEKDATAGTETYTCVNPELNYEKVKGSYSCIKSKALGSVIADKDGKQELTILNVTVVGTKDEVVMLKVNNYWKAEFKITIKETGVPQTESFEFTLESVNKEAAALYIFGAPGEEKATNNFKFTQIELTHKLPEGAAEDATPRVVSLLSTAWEGSAESKWNSYTGTSEWTYVKSNINFNVKAYSTVVMDIVGTEGAEILLKLEGGGAAVIEQRFTMTGKDQRITWTVSEANLTETGGQMFLFFLNPGVKGASEKNESVTIKSCALYMIKDEDEANKQSAIFYNTNGGSAVAPTYADKGATVTAPADPTRTAYVFAGWYTNPDFTGEAYKFDKMPNEQVVLYAKWLDDPKFSKEVDLLNATYTKLDANKETYTIDQSQEGKLVITKTGTEKYAFIMSDLKGDAIDGCIALVVEVKGTAGQTIAFKINDQQELNVTMTGEVQTIEIPFKFAAVNTAKPALLIFCQGGKEATSDAFTITKLQANSYLSNKSVLDATWIDPDGTYTITPEAGKLTVAKNDTKPGAWACIKTEMTGVDLIAGAYTKLVVTVKGPEGQKAIFKVNNIKEVSVVCTGEVQTVELDFSDITIKEANAALYIFCNAGVGEASGNFEITKLDFVR